MRSAALSSDVERQWLLKFLGIMIRRNEVREDERTLRENQVPIDDFLTRIATGTAHSPQISHHLFHSLRSQVSVGAH